jgi:hypothetical protein
MKRPSPVRLSSAVLAVVFVAAAGAAASPEPAAKAAPPTIEARTEGLERLDGFLPLYWDAREGRLHLEIARFGEEMLLASGFASGLGSNDIGLDRGALAGSRIVVFERVGRKVLMGRARGRRAAPEAGGGRGDAAGALARQPVARGPAGAPPLARRRGARPRERGARGPTRPGHRALPGAAAAPAPPPSAPAVPPGPPIGEPALEYLRTLEPPCSRP